MADVRALLRMAGAMVDLYCTSFRRCPNASWLDIDDTFDAVHGGQQLRLFNAHHDEYGFQPIVVFDGEGRFVAAVLRPAKRPKGVEIRGHLRRLVRAIRAHWPRVEILVRGDGHYGVPEVVDLCRAMDIRFILGAPTSARLRKHIVGLEAQVAARYAARPAGTDKLRRFTDFYDGAGSWSRTERIIARVETGDQGTDTRFIVTDLAGRSKALYEKVYCRRGTAENHIKAWKTHLAADRHLLHQGRRQPVPAVSPRRSLLAPVGVAQRHAEALRLARRPVRHAAAAADQDRGSRRRDEDTDPHPSADRLAGPGHPAPCPRPHPAPWRDVSDGARHAPPSNPSRNVLLS